MSLQCCFSECIDVNGPVVGGVISKAKAITQAVLSLFCCFCFSFGTTEEILGVEGNNNNKNTTNQTQQKTLKQTDSWE